jgi:integrase
VAREINRLSSRFVATTKEAKYHADGGGLYLQVTSAGSRSWIFVFQWQGRRAEMGLGSAAPGAVGLAAARQARDDARKLLREGINPIASRRAPAPIAPVLPTFGEVTSDLVAQLAPGWRSPKSPKLWLSTLKTHAPAIWDKPVRDVTTDDVLAALSPIWSAKPETARKLRGRMERVLRAAKVKGLRSGENPAAWRDHLEALLPPTQKLTKGHHPAMPFAELPGFISELRARPALAARALELLILTASRTSEVRLAKWEEVDTKNAIWNRPGEHMKGGKDHRVPLSLRAVEILANLTDDREPNRGALVFPGPTASKPLSTGALERVLDRMKLSHFTVHGFRSTFRDWVGEATSFPSEVAEMSLAHTVGGDVERAYRRGDMIERRRKLMDAWASFCGSTAAT